MLNPYDKTHPLTPEAQAEVDKYPIVLKSGWGTCPKCNQERWVMRKHRVCEHCMYRGAEARQRYLSNSSSSSSTE
jgi:hypothetical protein